MVRILNLGIEINKPRINVYNNGNNTTGPVLAYAGLSLGKDLGAFRRLSWRIIPVALAVTAGTFICATALAQVVLHLEGLI